MLKSVASWKCKFTDVYKLNAGRDQNYELAHPITKSHKIPGLERREKNWSEYLLWTEEESIHVS